MNQPHSLRPSQSPSRRDFLKTSAVAGAALAAIPAAAVHAHTDVEAIRHVDEFQWLPHDHPRGLATEEFIERAAVDADRALAGLQEDPGRSRLAPASAVEIIRNHR